MEQPPFASELRTPWERGEREQARYLTIGVAFYGNRNSAKTITCTRFLITDGSRLEKDIFTMQATGNGGRRACDLATFKKAIANHGLIYENQQEYEEKVRQYLFHFSDSNDYRRLLKQLLFLRRPNLISVLSLDNVRSYLDQSLPALPTELIQHAATTLEFMDTLEIEIKRRQDAYTAVEHLHHAQQAVCLTHIRLAACDYLYTHTQMNAAQKDVQRLKRVLTRAEHELQRAQAEIGELERERAEIEGKIEALEGSEELQAAKKLNHVQEKLSTCETDLRVQQQLLEDSIQRREATDQAIQTSSQEFERMHKQSSEQLTDLQYLAENVVHWTIAAEQLATALQQVQAFSLKTMIPHIAMRLSSLQEVPIQERLDWLNHLKQLHQEIKQNTVLLDLYQHEEAAASEALDMATRDFDRAYEFVCQGQQALADHLDRLLDQSAWQAAFLPLREHASHIWNERGSSEEIVEHVGMVLQNYQRELHQLLSRLKLEGQDLLRRQEPLKRQQWAQQVAVEQAWVMYERKRQEPEYTPPRSDHRVLARRTLNAHDIPALPLYMLLDVVPEKEYLAGNIE